MSERAKTWRQLAAAALAAVGVLVVAELVLRAVVAYPPPLREVEDAVGDLRRSDPTILVIGSSHARSFDSIGAELARRSAGREEMLSVPVEYGKLASYLWVFQHRLAPLLDEVGPDGSRRRERLRRAIIVTEWWDSCEPENSPVSLNLPARAWTFRDFASDVGRHGVTTFNRNYLANRWNRLWRPSLLIRDRGHGLLAAELRAAVRRPDPASLAARLDEQVRAWQGIVENGDTCLGSPRQLAALDTLLDALAERGVENTILLYPRKPNTLTSRARATTLARFSELAARQSSRHAARFVDMTLGTPLLDTDFAADFDHVTPDGNHKLAIWALDGPLGWLTVPPTMGPA